MLNRSVLKNTILSVIYKSSIILRKKDIFVFGAWSGMRYADNSKYLFEYYCTKGYECYWIGDEAVKGSMASCYRKHFIKKNSLKSYLILLKAKNIFVSHSYRDISKVNFFRNARLIQLWHGFPIKKVVADLKGDPGQQILSYERYNYFLCSSEEEEHRLMTAFHNWGISADNIIRCGKPRNDILTAKNKNYVAEIKEKFGLAEYDKVISYLPTFRDKTGKSVNFGESIAVESFLQENNFVLLERKHFKDIVIEDTKDMNQCNIKQMNNNIDTQELLLISDLLISDYSSIYIDYLILDRPIIHYLFDGDEYITSNREIYGDFESQFAGKIAYSEKEVIEFIKFYFNKPKFDSDKRKRLLKMSNGYDKKDNREYILNFLLNNG